MIRDRIKALRRVPADTLRQHEKNWRTHTDTQRTALNSVLELVGWADACIAYEDADSGQLILIDGHVRQEVAGTDMVPVLVLDVTEAESDKLLASIDVLAAMAGKDSDKLAQLLDACDSRASALIESVHPFRNVATDVDVDSQADDRDTVNVRVDGVLRSDSNVIVGAINDELASRGLRHAVEVF